MIRSRVVSFSVGVALVGSMLVSMPASLVSANDGPPPPDGRRGGAEQAIALPFVEDNNSCATVYAGQQNILLNSANSNLYVGSGQNYSGKVVRANGTAVAGAIVGSIMLNELPSPESPPVIVAASCAVTDAQGNFTVKVLFALQTWPESVPENQRGGRLTISPPFSPSDLATPLTGTLGSYSSSTAALVDTNANTAGVQLANITLAPANISWGSALVDTGQFADLSAAPFSAFCVGFDPDAPKTITCGMSRGAKITKSVTAVEFVSYNPQFDDWCQAPDSCQDPGVIKYLRVFLASASGFGFANQVKIEGLDGESSSLNGQYADTLPSKLIVQYCDKPGDEIVPDCLDGSTENDFWVDIPLPWSTDLEKTSVLSHAATITAVVWRANLTLSNNVLYNSGDKRFFIQGFHSHVIGDVVVPKFRPFEYQCDTAPESGDPGCSTYAEIVDPSGGLSVTDWLTEDKSGGSNFCPEPPDLAWKGFIGVDSEGTPLNGCAFSQLIPFNAELGDGSPGNPLTGWDWANQDAQQQGQVKDGSFSLTPSAGVYLLRIYPPQLADDDPNNQGATEFSTVIKWTADGDSFDTSTCADFDAYGSNNPTTFEPYEDVDSRCTSGWSDFPLDDQGVYQLTAPIANFKGRALDGTDPVQQVYVEIREWNGQYWDGTGSGAGTNKDGVFRTRLEEGLWQGIFRPNPDIPEHQDLSETSFFVRVNDQATVTCVSTVSLVGKPGCSSSISATEGIYDIPFVEPNFSGFVAISSSSASDRAGADGVCDGDSEIFKPGELCNEDDALEDAFIQIQPWNEFSNQYQWSPELQPFNSRDGGRFATNIPVGDSESNPDSRYRVKVEKPSSGDSALDDFASSSFNIRLDNGQVVCDQGYSTLNCVEGARPHAANPETARTGTWDLHLAAANLTGEVTADSVPVPFAEIRAELWNGQWFEWVNLFAQTNSIGKYAMNLSEPGTYKVSAEPPRWGSGATTFGDFSLTSQLVLVEEGGDLCEVNDVDSTECDAPSNSLDLDIALQDANVKILVKDGTTENEAPIANAWVGWAKYNEDLGWWEWQGGSGTTSAGRASFNIAPTPPDVEMLVRIEANPPWNGSTSLVRTSVDFVVYDNGSYRQCDESDYREGSCNNDLIDAGDPYSIVLDEGNVTGVIFDSGGTQPQQNSWIQVQKWEIPEWSVSEVWNWLPIGGNSNEDGEYGIDLASRGSGFFKLTAYPSWNRVNDLTPTSLIVYQDANGVVKACSEYSDSDMPGADSADCDGTSFDISLQGPTILGTLLDGPDGDPVPWAWVGLTQEVEAFDSGGNAADDTDIRSRSWYQWLGGASSNDEGSFGLRITEPGRYGIEVNPPWSSTLPRFTKYLYVESADSTIDAATEVFICADRQQSNDACELASNEWGSENRNLEFAAPNVWVKVCEPNTNEAAPCEAVTNSWVSVFSEYEWISGAQTNSQGIARFSLEPGDDYRFEANPNWLNPQGSRVETGFNRNDEDELTNDDDIVVDVDNLITEESVDADTTGNIIDVVNSTYSVLSLRLGSPNVTGSVKYKKNEVDTAMPWAYVSARTDDYSNWYGSPVDIKGNYALDLPDGTYVLTAYPNPSVAAGKSPVSKTVVVTSNALTSCAGNPAVECNFNFDDVPPNVSFTINGAGTLTRTWYFFEDDPVDGVADGVVGDDEKLVFSISATPSAAGVVTINVVLPAGDYVIAAQTLNTVATNGTTPIVDFSAGDACRSFGFTVDDDIDFSSTRTFVTDDEGVDATGMECPPS